MESGSPHSSPATTRRRSNGSFAWRRTSGSMRWIPDRFETPAGSRPSGTSTSSSDSTWDWVRLSASNWSGRALNDKCNPRRPRRWRSTQTLNTPREVRRPGGGFLLNEKTVAELQGKVRGEVIGPESKQYDEARKVYNAMIDKRPAVVVRCQGVADVIAAVKAARAERLTIAVRGGGHSVPGFGTADRALVIHPGRMKGIPADPAPKTVRAGGAWTL